MNFLGLARGIAVASTFAFFYFAAGAGAATITVNQEADLIGDTGACSLREAIDSANLDTASGASPNECAAGSGADTIAFDFPGTGTRTFQPNSVLPNLSTAMTIDGSFGAPGNDAIVFDGINASSNGINVTGNNVTLKALSIVRWSMSGVLINSVDNTAIRDCRIGTNESDTPGIGNSAAGVAITGDSDVTIIRNSVISGNALQGIRANGSTISEVKIRNNNIGLNEAGNAVLPNNGTGVELTQVTNSEVGGPALGNRISGNGGYGVSLGLTDTSLVSNNLIGTDQSGQFDLGNGGTGVAVQGTTVDTNITGNVISGGGNNGIFITGFGIDPNGPENTTITDNKIGTDLTGDDSIPNAGQGIWVEVGSAAGEPGTTIGGLNAPLNGDCLQGCNVIAGNVGNGVFIADDGAKVAVLGNSIRDNGGQGIDLSSTSVSDGLTPNDLGDADSGGNDFQNYPEIDAVLISEDELTTSVTGRLNSVASTSFLVQLFVPAPGDASDHGEGSFLVDSFTVPTDATGFARFGRTIGPVEDTSELTVTATKLGNAGATIATSEFGRNTASACDQSGGPEPNTLTADGTGQALCGLGGDDILQGKAGGDIFAGSTGSDTADLSLSTVAVTGNLVTDRVVSSVGVDVLTSIENLTGSPLADTLTGSPIANTIDGGAGADEIDPGLGVDTVLGGNDNDTIDVADGAADASVNCGAGTDTVQADALATDPAAIFTGCETINRGSVTPTCETDPTLCPPPTCLTDPTLCPPDPEPTVYKCDGKKATIVGTNKNQTINGTNKRDVIVGRGGADKINGKGGNDLVCGGDGKDAVNAGDGNDVVSGQAGNDKLNGQNGKDTLKGGDGDDTLKGGGGAKDKVLGQGGKDKLDGGGGKKDTCDGGSAKDRKKAPGCEKKKKIP